MKGMRPLNGLKWMRRGHATDPFTSVLMTTRITGSKTDGEGRKSSKWGSTFV